MTTECEHYEIDLVQRQRGALDGREETRLQAHLATCPSCRAFDSSNGDIASALERQVSGERARIDWTALEAGVRRTQRNHKIKLWLAPLFVFQVPIIFALRFGKLPPPQLLLSSPLTALLVLGWLWLAQRPLRQLAAAGRSGDDLLAGYARELERKATRLRIFGALHGTLAVASLALALTQSSLRGFVYFGVFCTAVFAGWAALDLAVRLPRVRAERARFAS